jgi:chromosome segregation ATPase
VKLLTNDLGERIRGAETNIENLDKRVSKLEGDNNLLHKMNVLLEVVINSNKELKRQTDGFYEVTRSIDANLTSLNNHQETLNSKLDSVNDRVDAVNERVGKVEDDIEQTEDENSLKINLIWSNLFKGLLYSAPFTILLTLILKFLGLG